jgi:hypothetical protein
MNVGAKPREKPLRCADDLSFNAHYFGYHIFEDDE